MTALVNTTGTVVERYAYDPFGTVTYQNASGTTIAASTLGWQYLHQGGRLNAASSLYSFRNREYSSTLGRWVNMDPIKYEAGDVNLYRYVGNSPYVKVDPSGLEDTKFPPSDKPPSSPAKEGVLDKALKDFEPVKVTIGVKII